MRSNDTLEWFKILQRPIGFNSKCSFKFEYLTKKRVLRVLSIVLPIKIVP